MRYSEFNENLTWAVDSDMNKASPFSQKDQKDSENVVIWVDIRKLLNATNTDQKLDLDDLSAGENAIKGRVEKAIRHFQDGNYMDPSLVSLGYRGIDFTDGRHRLVAAYRLGEKIAPIIVPVEQAQEIQELLK
jgi:hypothetical protein